MSIFNQPQSFYDYVVYGCLAYTAGHSLYHTVVQIWNRPKSFKNIVQAVEDAVESLMPLANTLKLSNGNTLTQELANGLEQTAISLVEQKLGIELNTTDFKMVSDLIKQTVTNQKAGQ